MADKVERYYPEVEGYEGNWVDIVDAWTFKEVKEMGEAGEDEYWEIFSTKVKAMELTDQEGKVFRDPTAFGTEQLENFDISIASFLGAVMPMHIERRKQLGKWSARQLRDGSGEKK